MYLSAEKRPRGGPPDGGGKGPQLEVQRPERGASLRPGGAGGPRAADARPEGSKSHRGPVVISVIVLLLLAIGGGIYLYYWFLTSGTVSTDNAAIDGLSVSVSSKTADRILSIAADEGDAVEEGQLLVELDDAELRDQEVQLTAELKHTRLNLGLAVVKLQTAKKEYDRQKSLYDSGNTALQQYEQASYALATARVGYALAQGQIPTAEARLQAIRTRIENTRIAAPISGVVTRRSSMPGEVVQPGQPMLVITDLKDVWITAKFEETDIRLIRPGQPVDVTIDAYPNAAFEGRVERVSSAIVPPPFSIGESTKTTQKIPVRIALVEAPAGVMLLPGMSVVVSVKVE